MTGHWTYLFAYSGELSEDKVREVIDSHPHIVNWQKYLPHAYFIVSDLTAKYIAAELREKLGDSRMIVLDTNADRDGWLPERAWDLMRNPRAVGEENK